MARGWSAAAGGAGLDQGSRGARSARNGHRVRQLHIRAPEPFHVPARGGPPGKAIPKVVAERAVCDPAVKDPVSWPCLTSGTKARAVMVPLMTVYRSCGAAVTTRTPEPAVAEAFLAFLDSTDGKSIFAKWGWITMPVPQG